MLHVPEMKEKSEAENYTAGIISQLAVHGMHSVKSSCPVILSSQLKLYSRGKNKKVAMRSQQTNEKSSGKLKCFELVTRE